jgi:hypothetical protein
MIDKAAWRDVLHAQQRRYPEMQPADVYKLVYQVLNGTGHAFSDLDEAREMLLEELANLIAPAVALEEPVVETVSPRGAPVTVVRVHLRPFHTLGLDPEKLLTAVAETSLLLPAREAEPIKVAWPALMPLLGEELGFRPEDVEALGREVELGRYPPLHHSAPYRQAYAPQYRVAARRALRREFGEEFVP